MCFQLLSMLKSDNQNNESNLVISGETTTLNVAGKRLKKLFSLNTLIHSFHVNILKN